MQDGIEERRGKRASGGRRISMQWEGALEIMRGREATESGKKCGASDSDGAAKLRQSNISAYKIGAAC